MPANITDHATWERAKQAAAKRGKGEDWDYVMSIYQDMGGGFTKSERFHVDVDELDKSLWPNFRGHSYHAGQVPRMSIPSSLTKMPAPDSLKRRMAFDEPVLRPEGITRGLGLEPGQEKAIQTEVVESLDFPELNFRQRLLQKLQYLKLDYPQRSAIAQRARTFYRDNGDDHNERERLERRFRGLRKGEAVESFHIDEDELEKAAPRGGTYVARVAKKGGGYRYHYDEEKYSQRPDAHLSGRAVLKGKCKGELCAKVGNGIEMEKLVKQMQGGKYDDDLIKDAIRAAVKDGTLVHDSGKLRPRKAGDNMGASKK